MGPDGISRSAPGTFATEREARKWLTIIESEVLKDAWSPPEAGEVELNEYGAQWISERKLAPRTRELYEDHFRLHIRPHLGHLMIGTVRPATIRAWRKRLLDSGVHEPQAVKAYCLLRAILNTAVREDGLIRENPCRIKGYDTYHTPERPTGGVDQVYQLAAAMPARFRALVLLAALSGLRWGELAALRRCDIDLTAGVVRVPRKLAVLRAGVQFGPPKSQAGNRAVALPTAAVTELRAHMRLYVAAGDEALLFTGDKGGILRTSNFRRAVKWDQAVKLAGLPAGFHFHDLRHTGNNLAAAAGASTRELMHRMGHASMRAALIYQHATRERDREIAAAIDARLAQRGPMAHEWPTAGPEIKNGRSADPTERS